MITIYICLISLGVLIAAFCRLLANHAHWKTWDSIMFIVISASLPVQVFHLFLALRQGL